MPMSRARFATWDAASPAQRRLLVAAAIVVLLAVALVVGGVPLTSAIARSEVDVARSRMLLDVARERVADNESLARASTPSHAGDVRSAVERAMASQDIRATPVAGRASAGQFAIVIPEAAFDRIVAAIDALALQDGVQVVEATITALVDRGAVRAELTLAR